MANRANRRKTSRSGFRHRIAGLTALILVLSVLSGCLSIAGLARIESPAAGLNLESAEWTTLRIELFDRDNTPPGAPPPTNNHITQYIQEHFGNPSRIKVEFVTVPRAEEVERLNVLMAANQAPDIVFTYDLPTVYNYAIDGKLTDLSPLIEAHGQDLSRLLGSELLEAGMIDGKQYAIPAMRVLRAHTTTLIREDWLEALGLPLPETTAQFYEALKAMKEMRSAELGGHFYPYGHIDHYHTSSLRYSFWEWDRITEEDFYANPDWVMPGNKEAFRFLNRLYHEGLIDPNFHLDRFAQQFRTDLVSGRVGAGAPNTNEPVYMGYLAELERNDPAARLTPIDPFDTPEGKKPKPILELTGMYIMVPKNSGNAEAAVKYLNWMAQREHYIPLQYGIEGVTYRMEEGLPVMLDTEETKRILLNYFDYCIILNGRFVSAEDMRLNLKANAERPRYEAFTAKSVEYAMNDGIELPRIKTMTPSEIQYGVILHEQEEEIFVKVVTAPPESFDAVYDQEVTAYMAMGGAQLQAEKRRAYRAMP